MRPIFKKNSSIPLFLILCISILISEKGYAEKWTSPWNHPDLNWYSIDTDHFVIHFPISRKKDGNPHYLSAEWTARKAAKVAEEMYPKICRQFNYYLKEKIHIVILEQPDWLEGFTVPDFDWIVISANPGTLYRFRGRMEWLSDVLVHEFSHVISLKANSNFSEGGSTIIIGGLYMDGINNHQSGAQILIGGGEPFWWVEGGAEYWSDNGGYNWWSTSRDMFLRMTVLEDRLLTYDEWVSRVDKSGFDGERGYNQGYSMGIFLREEYGDDTYAKFALEYGKGWTLNWETVVKKVLGVSAEELYERWKRWVEDKYRRVEREVMKNPVIGDEIFLTEPIWLSSDPKKKESWEKKSKADKVYALEKSGLYNYFPAYSPDGKYLAYWKRGSGIYVQRIKETDWPQINGKYYDSEKDKKKLEELKKVSFSIKDADAVKFSWSPDGKYISFTGPEDYAPKFFKETNLVPNLDGYSWRDLYIAEVIEKGEDRVITKNHKLTNHIRAIDSCWSQDGKSIAFVKYADGTDNIGIVDVETKEVRYLTDFHDGTQIGGLTWSPDGKKLAFYLFRNYQQDIWTIDADGSNLKPLTLDKAEDVDPFWAKDGKIYYSSDYTGIFNIYSIDPETGEQRQITNVLGGAFMPCITPQGNLFYTYFTGHGFKIYAIPKEKFLNKKVQYASIDITPEMVQENLSFEEELPSLSNVRDYSVFSSLMPPAGYPWLEFGYDDVQAGFEVFVMDYVEDHVAAFDILQGDDKFYRLLYWNHTWHPTFLLAAMRYEIKYDYGILIDRDEIAESTEDQELIEIRGSQFANIAGGYTLFPINPHLWIGGGLFYIGWGLKYMDDEEWIPYLQSIEPSLFLEYSTFTEADIYRGDFILNPRGGRRISIDYMYPYSNVLYENFNGQDVDDYEILDDYFYHTLQVNYTEFIPIPWLEKYHHTLQLNLTMGYIDRNVQYNDEFKAGGKHPYWWGRGSINPLTQFSGYEPWSLTGETMAILDAAYRFPIYRNIDKKIGPIYIDSLWGQVMGTAGNLWSFKLKEGADTYKKFWSEVAVNPEDIEREIPFVDVASKNGNYLVYDAGVELRLRASLFNRYYWNSFLRVARGFNDLTGVSDPNGDNIYTNIPGEAGDFISDEVEPARWRLYLGIGTGW